MRKIRIEEDMIKLDSLLKLADFAQTGGHAKIMIQDGLIKVNGNVEYQRGKKIKPGDQVSVEGQVITVVK
ncbi:RNA-binding S4 domain-containing protein [Geosporobacter subterraneus]|nr:RNA-binding S4 domain-containing protein [Geosporobacter subterraneus]